MQGRMVDDGTGDKSWDGVRVCHYPHAPTLPKVAFFRLFPRPSQVAVTEGRPAPLCVKCGGVACHLSQRSPENETWTCAVCDFQNAAYFNANDLAYGLPEFTRPEVEYRTPLSTVTADGKTCGLVLVLDRTMPSKEEAILLMDRLASLLMDKAEGATLDPLTPVSLIIFGRAISIYKVGLFGGDAQTPSVIASDVIDGHCTLRQQDLARVKEGFRLGQLSVPLHAGAAHLSQCLRALVEEGVFRYTTTAEEEVDRCLGAAISCVTRAYSGAARVLVVTTGPPTDPCVDEALSSAGGGGGAGMPQELYTVRRQRLLLELGREAIAQRGHSKVIDIICLGLAPRFDVSSLHGLSCRSGGSLVLHPSAADPTLAMDLHKCLTRPLGGVEVEFRASEHIHIDVLDESLGLGRFKGTGDARELKDDGAWEEARARQQLYDKRHDRSSIVYQPPKWPSSLCRELANVDLAAKHDLGVSFRVRDSIFGTFGIHKSNLFVLQAVIRYTSPDGHWLITRVLTQRINLKVTSFDHSALPVVVVKEAVALVAKSQGDASCLEAGRKVVDDAVKALLNTYPNHQAYTRSQGSTARPYLAEFEGALEALYQARRGPLLGKLMLGGDSVDSLRRQFLAASLEDARRLMAPMMLCSAIALEARGVPIRQDKRLAEDNGLVLWPCESMGLWPSMVLLLDTQERLLIWTGASAAQELSSNPEGDSTLLQLDVFRAYCDRIRVGRFPTPKVLEFQAGDPSARFVQSRVLASHKDPPSDLETRFTELRWLHAEEMKSLRENLGGALLCGDDASLAQYLKGFGQ